MLTLVHQEDRSYITDLFNRLIEGDAIDVECRFIRNGDQRTLRINAGIESRNDRQLIFGHAEDITVSRIITRR